MSMLNVLISYITSAITFYVRITDYLNMLISGCFLLNGP